MSDFSTEPRSVKWKMECEVNGSCFEFNGVGSGSAHTGQVDLELRSTGFPDGFEPISCPLICNAPVTIGFAKNDSGLESLWAVAGESLNVEPARAGSIYDARGAELLRLSVSSTVAVRGDTALVGNRMTGFSHLPPLQKVMVPVDEYIIPNGAGRALSSIRFSLLTRSGESLTGVTVVPYSWSNGRTLEGPLTRRYEMVDVWWDGARDVRTSVRSSLHRLGSELTDGLEVSTDSPGIATSHHV